jgi:Tfp pilus assembly protein PilO
MSRINHLHLSQREKKLIILLFTVFLLTGFWKLGGVRYWKELSSLRENNSKIKQEIEMLNEVIANRETIEIARVEAEGNRLRLESLLPSMKLQPEALGNLESRLRNSSATFTTMRINETICQDRFCELSLFAEVTSQSETISILDQLESFPQLLLIDQIEWRSNGEQTENMQLS